MTTKHTMNYTGYTHYISSEPSYYGSTVTPELCAEIVRNLRSMIESEFPGITVREYHDGDGSCKTTGERDSVCAEIDLWVSRNWTAAL